MLDQALVDAYRVTDYVLFLGDGQEVTLNIGARSADFDRVLDRRKAATAALVTAHNPRSVVLSEAENRMRHRELTGLLEARGYDYVLGEARDPTGAWKAELECVVFGIPPETGLELARRFHQYAIVFVTRGGVPELLYPTGV